MATANFTFFYYFFNGFNKPEAKCYLCDIDQIQIAINWRQIIYKQFAYDTFKNIRLEHSAIMFF